MSSKSLPVLIFNSVTPKMNGGVKKFVDELIEGFRSKDIQVIDQIGSQQKGIQLNFKQMLALYLKNLKKVKIVHFIVLSPYNVPFVILAKLFRKKIITSYHGIFFEESSPLKEPHIFIPFWIADKIFRSCSDMITSPSAYLLDEMKISHKAMIIPLPFNTKSLELEFSRLPESSSKEITLVTASNFDIEKKSRPLIFLLEAMGRISKQFDSVKLLVFGDGTNLDKFREENISKNHVIFMGFRDDFRNFLANSVAYVHISGLDTQSYAIIEAMMLGKVVLCNDLKGITQTIEPKNNYVVSLDSTSITNGLRSMIIDIKENRDLFNEKGKQNKKFALEKYSSDIIIEKFCELYESFL